MNPGTARPIPQNTASSTPGTHHKDDCKRAIKRDQSAFKEFKNDKVWDSWNRGFIAQIKAQDLHEVIDETHAPMTAEETAICNVKKDFLCTALNNVLLTDEGKEAAQAHEADGDSRAVCKKILTHCEKSTSAKLNSSDLMKCVTAARINDGHWNGAASAFVHNWKNKTCLYDNMVNAPMQDDHC